ncbi:hypothetical protein Goarm_009886, partial [Gossypium armourianum]|nr:hypothetical protein [Gossypium armourianum]
QHLVTAVTEEKGTTCWGCGLGLLLPTLGPAFKCGWCGAITNHNLNKTQNQCLLWRRLRDRCFVSFLFSFMLFVMMTMTQIGNCVGAANHRHFIAFLISVIFSTIYVTVMSAYTSFLIWPPLRYKPPEHSTIFSTGLVMLASREGLVALLSSAMELPVRGLVLIYLFIASISVEISLSVLLWQQLCYIYEGRTYLSHLSSREGDHLKEKDCQNLLRFFGCRYSMLRFLPTLRNSRKRHKT